MDEVSITKINDLNEKIDAVIEKFSDISRCLNEKDEATYLNHSKWQWTGGIIGAIAEYKQEKRLEKLLDTPIYGDLSYYKMTWFIIEETEKMVDAQAEIQKLTTPQDLIYYENIKKILDSLLGIIQAWYNYSPEAANASLTIGKEKNVGLYLTVDYQTKELLRKLDLPPELKLYDTPESKNSGCMGIIIGFAIIQSLFIYFLL